MKKAIDEVKAQPDYASNGEVGDTKECRQLLVLCDFDQQWVITDARHDSTANAFHTTVPCLSGRWELVELCMQTLQDINTIS